MAYIKSRPKTTNGRYKRKTTKKRTTTKRTGYKIFAPLRKAHQAWQAKHPPPPLPPGATGMGIISARPRIGK